MQNAQRNCMTKEHITKLFLFYVMSPHIWWDVIKCLISCLQRKQRATTIIHFHEPRPEITRILPIDSPIEGNSIEDDMSFSVYKHSISTASPQPTGDAGAAINTNFHNIADLFDTYLALTGGTVSGNLNLEATTTLQDYFRFYNHQFQFENDSGWQTMIDTTGNFSVFGTTSLDGGSIYTDGYGGLTFNTIGNSTIMNANQGISLRDGGAGNITIDIVNGNGISIGGGSVYTDHNTIDDGNGNATFAGNINFNGGASIGGSSGSITLSGALSVTATISTSQDIAASGTIWIGNNTPNSAATSIHSNSSTVIYFGDTTGLDIGNVFAFDETTGSLYMGTHTTPKTTKVIDGTGAHFGSGANLTSLNATNIGSGTVAAARLPSTINATTVAGTLTVSANNIATDTSTGTKIGTAATQKLGFFNATPIVQPSGANQAALTDSTGGTASTTLASITAGASYAQADMVAVKNAIASLARLLNQHRTDLVALGLEKGSA